MKNILISTEPHNTRGWILDAVLALATFAFGCAQMALANSTVVFRDEAFRNMVGITTITPNATMYFVLALTTLPLVLRRRFSWPVFIFVSAIFGMMQTAFHGVSLSIVGPMVALFTLCSERNRYEAITACVLALVGLVLFPMRGPSEGMSIILRMSDITFAALAALAGFGFRAYQGYVTQTEQRAIAAEKSREEEAARRVEEERVRIAREIHDITAHSLSAVSIQAAVAEKMIDRNPEAAREAIVSVRTTSKQALEEIRSMIGVLRSEDAAETEPTEGTDRMEDLCDYLRRAGIAVTYVDDTYDKSTVPAYIDVALFGIAREAVTNVVRHAEASGVEITLAQESDRVHVVVSDNGRGVGDATPSTQGHGIQGMSERVHVLGGTFAASDRIPAGFTVDATIPLPDRN